MKEYSKHPFLNPSLSLILLSCTSHQSTSIWHSESARAVSCDLNSSKLSYAHHEQRIVANSLLCLTHHGTPEKPRNYFVAAQTNHYGGPQGAMHYLREITPSCDNRRLLKWRSDLPVGIQQQARREPG